MAVTQFGHADPRTEKIWSDKTFKFAVENMELTRRGLMGTTDNRVIQVNSQLVNKPGDSITFKLRRPLESEGVGDDGTIEGNEEALSIMNYTVQVHERGHGVVSAGLMSEKRTNTDFRPAARDGLGLWSAERMENDMIAAMAGLYNVPNIETVNEAYPSSGRIYYGGQNAAGTVATAKTTDALLSAETNTDYLFGPKIVKLIKRKALAVRPKFRPVETEYGRYFVMLIHPLQAKALKATTEWLNSKYYANIRGWKNPLFTGALGVIDGVVIHEYERTPIRTGANGTEPYEGFLLNAGKDATDDAVADGKTVARALFCGAQAGCFAWGVRPRWKETYADAGFKPRVAMRMLYATSKSRFNVYTQPAGANTAQEDFACWAVDTQCVVD